MIEKYFQKLEKVPYDMFKDGNKMDITNIFKRVKLLKSILDNNYVTYEYYVQEGDTPEMIADAYYGSPHYYWIVLLSNDISDVYGEWALDEDKFIDYLNDVYADNFEKNNGQQRANQKVHHYEDYFGNVIHKDTYLEKLEKPGSQPPKVVSYLEWETIRNNRKRYIKLLNNDYLKSFLDKFETMLKGEEVK